MTERQPSAAEVSDFRRLMKRHRMTVPMMVCREVLVACDCDTVKAEQLLRDQGWGGTC